MASTPPADAPEKLIDADTPAPPEAFDLSIGEFCTRLSMSQKSVEMIAGFHSDEVRAGRMKDSESAFAERFDAFAVRPV